VRKKIENEEIMIKILSIIEIAYESEMKNEFKMITKINKKDNPRILFNHSFPNLPKTIIGMSVDNKSNNGIK
jgi:hypothetical protein